MTRCLVCSAAERKSIGYPLPKNPLFKGLTVGVCGRCGFGAVEQHIDPAELRRYYETTYAEHANRKDKPDPARYFSDPAALFKPRRSLSQLQLAQSRLPAPPGVVLDLGAGFGTTLHLARRDFWPQAEFIAVEPDLSMQPYLAALGCRQVPGLEDVAPQSCDLIVASHVLEHFQATEIEDVLTRLRSLLRPGGRLLAEVPNSDFSANPEVAGHSHEPHLLFFSRGAFGRLVESCGFRVDFLATVGSPRRRRLSERLAGYLRRLAGRPPAEYGGNRAALRLLAG